MIEKGEISQIHEEIETSVGYYHMQSMNQSLMALLVHGTISYAEAMRQSPDPEDLSLKLRRMFPKIEERGGEVATSDFSEIVELQQFKRLYEEQEEKVKLILSEKEMEISALHGAIRERDVQTEELGRLRQEAQEKIDKLMERIKELNQRLMGGGGSGGGEPERKTGIFR